MLNLHAAVASSESPFHFFELLLVILRFLWGRSAAAAVIEARPGPPTPKKSPGPIFGQSEQQKPLAFALRRALVGR